MYFLKNGITPYTGKSILQKYSTQEEWQYLLGNATNILLKIYIFISLTVLRQLGGCSVPCVFIPEPWLAKKPLSDLCHPLGKQAGVMAQSVALCSNRAGVKIRPHQHLCELTGHFWLI